MDVDSIPLGTNFVKVLGEEVAKCDALLAFTQAEAGARTCDKKQCVSGRPG